MDVATDWYTLPQVARMIGKSPAGVRFLVAQKRIEARKGPRGWWLVHRTEVERLRRELAVASEEAEPAPREPEWVRDPNKASLNIREQLAPSR